MVNKEEIKFGKRIIFVSYKGKHNEELCKFFIDLIKKIEKPSGELMDKYKIPGEIYLNFKFGDGSLDGIYFVQRKDVAEHMVIIDVYTRQLQLKRTKSEMINLKINLIETFIHELIHHKISREGKTAKAAKGIALGFVKNYANKLR